MHPARLATATLCIPSSIYLQERETSPSEAHAGELVVIQKDLITSPIRTHDLFPVSMSTPTNTSVPPTLPKRRVGLVNTEAALHFSKKLYQIVRDNFEKDVHTWVEIFLDDAFPTLPYEIIPAKDQARNGRSEPKYNYQECIDGKNVEELPSFPCVPDISDFYALLEKFQFPQVEGWKASVVRYHAIREDDDDDFFVCPGFAFHRGEVPSHGGESEVVFNSVENTIRTELEDNKLLSSNEMEVVNAGKRMERKLAERYAKLIRDKAEKREKQSETRDRGTNLAEGPRLPPRSIRKIRLQKEQERMQHAQPSTPPKTGSTAKSSASTSTTAAPSKPSLHPLPLPPLRRTGATTNIMRESSGTMKSTTVKVESKEEDGTVAAEGLARLAMSTPPIPNPYQQMVSNPYREVGSDGRRGRIGHSSKRKWDGDGDGDEEMVPSSPHPAHRPRHHHDLDDTTTQGQQNPSSSAQSSRSHGLY